MAWSRTSRHVRGYGHQWDKLRQRILSRDNHLCQECLRGGKVTAGNQVDHITPKAKRGTDDESNLQCLCKPCHDAKTERESAEAQGRTVKRRLTFGADGWPVEGQH